MSRAAEVEVLIDGVPPSANALGRTEDLVLTPDGRWLVVAGYADDCIWAFDVRCATGAIVLGPARRLDSDRLRGPHGVAVLASTAHGSLLAVANRAGRLSFHRITPEGALIDLDVHESIDHLPTLRHAASVLCTGRAQEGSVVLYSCSNDVPVLRCTTLQVDVTSLRITEDRAIELPLVAVPDGLAVSADGMWLALSNHRYHRVHLYSLERPMVDGRLPDGVVSGIAYPHGLRFLPGDTALLIADAGAPYVHVVDGSRGWTGLHTVTRTLRVLDQAMFIETQHNPQEGGPKGLDITPDGRTFVITSQWQPIAAFEVPTKAVASDPEAAAWAADRARTEFEEWFADGVMNARLETEVKDLREQVAAWNDTKLVRWSRPFRAIYARLRRSPR